MTVPLLFQVDIFYGGEMLRNVTRGKYLRYLWIFAACAASITSIVIVVKICLTGTEVNSRLQQKQVAKSLLVAPTNQTVQVSTVTSFHGSLIDSFDQLTGVDDVNSFRCFDAKIANMKFPICAYEDSKDIWVSKSFTGGGYWEGGFVGRFMSLLRRYPDVEFVDLGANIGTFALPAAHLTHVVAVEPYSRSMGRLLKSVQLGGVAKNVSLVFNAISNQRSTYTLGFYPTNVGGTYLKIQKTFNTTDCRGGLCARTILLDDLLPLMGRRRAVMKVDVEGHQPQVFTDSTAVKFFDLIDVPVILMEWNLCGQNAVRPEVTDLIRFFTKRQYQVFSASNLRLGTDCSQWSGNVVFTKQSLVF